MIFAVNNRGPFKIARSPPPFFSPDRSFNHLIMPDEFEFKYCYYMYLLLVLLFT